MKTLFHQWLDKNQEDMKDQWESMGDVEKFEMGGNFFSFCLIQFEAETQEKCISCGDSCGTLLICDQCRHANKTGEFDKQFQERVCRDAGWICSYCGADCSEPEERRQLVCADHIKTKGAHPELRYDLSNARCACGFGVNDCHNKRGRGVLSPFQPHR